MVNEVNEVNEMGRHRRSTGDEPKVYVVARLVDWSVISGEMVSSGSSSGLTA